MQQRLKQPPRSARAKVISAELFHQLDIARAPCARRVSHAFRMDGPYGAWTRARKHGWSRGSRWRVIVASYCLLRVGGAGGTRTRLSGSTIRQLHPWPTAPIARLVLIVAEEAIQLFRRYAFELLFKLSAVVPVVWLSPFLSLARVDFGEVGHVRRTQSTLLREAEVATLRLFVRSAAVLLAQRITPSRTPPVAACARHPPGPTARP